MELSEKEIRVIKVALYQHWMNMTDVNGDAIKKEQQEFSNLCFDLYKKFDEKDKKCDFNELK